MRATSNRSIVRKTFNPRGMAVIIRIRRETYLYISLKLSQILWHTVTYFGKVCVAVSPTRYMPQHGIKCKRSRLHANLRDNEGGLKAAKIRLITKRSPRNPDLGHSNKDFYAEFF